MKKYILTILFLVMLIPFYVKAETCDTDKISISSIAIESKSDNVEELSEATVSGKNFNLNLSMSEVGDTIKYKIVVKNDSNEDYELDTTSLNLNSDYVNYLFETVDNTNVVKANSSKKVTLTVEYKTEVPENKFENGSYSDNKAMVVQLSNGETITIPDTFKNPNTGAQAHILIILILLLISGSLYILLKKKEYTKFMVLIIGMAIFIPIGVYAICKCEIIIESKVLISNKKHNVYVTNDYGWNTKQYLDNNYVSYDAFEDRYFIMDNEKYIYYQDGILNIGQYKEGELVSTGEIHLGKRCLDSDYQNTNHCSNIQNSSLGSSFYCDRNNFCTASDYEELNFSNYFIDWRGDWYPRFPTEFIMPNHDVYFVINDG